MAEARQHGPRQLLVDGVVLGDQHAQAIGVRGGGDAGGAGRSGARVGALAGGRGDGLAELRLADRLDQVRRDLQLAAAIEIARLAIGRQHDHDGAAEVVAGPGELEQREAVDAGHVDVDQQEVERLAPGPRRVERGERRLGVGRERRHEAPQAQRLVEDAAIGVVVVDDQHALPGGDVDGPGRPRLDARRRPGGEARGDREREDAAVAFAAGQRDRAAHQRHEAAGDGQAQAGAAERARDAGVGLLEGVEHPRLLRLGDADARVADGEGEDDAGRGSRRPPATRRSRSRRTA